VLRQLARRGAGRAAGRSQIPRDQPRKVLGVLTYFSKADLGLASPSHGPRQTRMPRLSVSATWRQSRASGPRNLRGKARTNVPVPAPQIAAVAGRARLL